jgi:serine phosphatase RsbU (regulator of sigma subunit)
VVVYPGALNGQAVRVYRAPITGRDKPMGAYVAVRDVPPPVATGPGLPLGLVLSLVAALLVGGLGFAIANGHTRSLRNLALDLDKLGRSGDPGRGLRATGAEATQVARAVERMIGNIEFRAKEGGADLDEIVDRERKVADEIHGQLMAKNPPRLSDYEVETLFKPGFEIAGDHFEYFRIDDSHLGLILLDTNVRGITAALVMSATKAYVRAAAPGNLSPAEVLRRVNANLAGDLPAGRHVTALYAVIDTSQGKVTIASAGHLPLLVYRHATGKMAKVNPEGIALGLDVGPVFDRTLQEGDVPIGVGDRIVIYTDGALKVQAETGEEFGEQRFYEVVHREAPKNSQAFVNFVGGAIDQFHLTSPQNDDITISTVKRLR